MNPTPEGEAATPPPPADYSAPPTPHVRKPWPVLLAQAMRTGRYVNAQQALVGAVACRVPDPDTLLTIGGRWQVTHKRLRAVRRELSAPQQTLIRAYLERDDTLMPRQDEDQRTYYVAVPPEMRDGEPEAFAALWRALHAQGVLERLPPRPSTDNQEST